MRQATTSFVMSARPSAWNNSTPTGRIFIKFDMLVFFENLSRKFKLLSNLTTTTGTSHEDQYTFMIISRAILLRMKMFQTKVLNKIKTHFIFNNFYFIFFRKSCRVWNNVEKYRRAGQDTDDIMAHAHCMLHNKSYKHTFRICNTHYFSTATMVARKRLNLTLYVQCLSCLLELMLKFCIY